MRIVYTADIDEEIYETYELMITLNETMEAAVGCKVIKSKLETDEEVCEMDAGEDDVDCSGVAAGANREGIE